MFVFILLVFVGLACGLLLRQQIQENSLFSGQEALIYTESEDLALGLQGLIFSDWKLKIVVIDEPTEWEIKTLAGHGAHLILIEHQRMEKLDQMGLLERASVRVPLFSFIATDFRKTTWSQIFLPLFWENKSAHLDQAQIWGLSVPRNTPDRKLSWKAFYEIVGHPLFKAKLAGTKLGLTLAEFENSTLPAQRKPSWLRTRLKD